MFDFLSVSGVDPPTALEHNTRLGLNTTKINCDHALEQAKRYSMAFWSPIRSHILAQTPSLCRETA